MVIKDLVAEERLSAGYTGARVHWRSWIPRVFAQGAMLGWECSESTYHTERSKPAPLWDNRRSSGLVLGSSTGGPGINKTQPGSLSCGANLQPGFLKPLRAEDQAGL
ncbi:hypothetical protein QAD02_010250 [Eretmocerus hayati]|uniref:Uncharacterized protein n=1 Tax=Eretmocerus hayati TaxID=131215 RepID=A0ACC2NBZ1_9HYME|nr:hypothetical protein QAD02_010250 [Eretmocerus hayati]